MAQKLSRNGQQQQRRGHERRHQHQQCAATAEPARQLQWQRVAGRAGYIRHEQRERALHGDDRADPERGRRVRRQQHRQQCRNQRLAARRPRLAGGQRVVEFHLGQVAAVADQAGDVLARNADAGILQGTPGLVRQVLRLAVGQQCDVWGPVSEVECQVRPVTVPPQHANASVDEGGPVAIGAMEH
jgi:hypothetical protein